MYEQSFSRILRIRNQKRIHFIFFSLRKRSLLHPLQLFQSFNHPPPIQPFTHPLLPFFILITLLQNLPSPLPRNLVHLFIQVQFSHSLLNNLRLRLEDIPTNRRGLRSIIRVCKLSLYRRRIGRRKRRSSITRIALADIYIRFVKYSLLNEFTHCISRVFLHFVDVQSSRLRAWIELISAL